MKVCKLYENKMKWNQLKGREENKQTNIKENTADKQTKKQTHKINK